MMNIDHNDQELVTVRLGIDAEAFLASELGKHLMQRAEDDIEDATAALIGIAPDDVRGNTMLRNRIYVARQFKHWMIEAIQQGRAAYDRIKDQEANQIY